MEINRRKFWEDYWGPYLSRWEKVLNFLNPASNISTFFRHYLTVYFLLIWWFSKHNKSVGKKKTHTHTPTRRVKILCSTSS